MYTHTDITEKHHSDSGRRSVIDPLHVMTHSTLSSSNMTWAHPACSTFTRKTDIFYM